MESQCWFYCYPEKLLCDTLHLDAHDFGAYCRALMWYYANGPLPNDEQMIRNIMHVREQDWARCWGNLMPFFSQNGDGHWHQKRADVEIDRRNEIIKRRQEQTKAARSAKNKPPVTTRVTTAVTTAVAVSNSSNITLEKALERIESRMEWIKGQGSKTAMGMIFSPAQREELESLRISRKEILDRLGFKA